MFGVGSLCFAFGSVPLCFNHFAPTVVAFTFFVATRTDLSLEEERHLIWAPDVVGSILFLVASWLAYSEVNRGVLGRRQIPRGSLAEPRPSAPPRSKANSVGSFAT